MAVIDSRSGDNLGIGGSSLLAFLISGADQDTIFGGTGASDGWVVFGHLEGGEIGPQRETVEVKNEADELVLELTDRNEFIIGNTLLEVDDASVQLLEWLEDNARRARYPVTLNNGDTQWWFFPNAQIRKQDWRMNTSRGEPRKIAFEAVASVSGANPVREGPVVLPADQNDTAWDSYADYKDTATP